MERIVKVGPHYFDVVYDFNENDVPVILEIFALSGVILFDGTTTIILEASDPISVSGAERYTVDLNGQFRFMKLLTETLQIPKTNPALQAVS